MIVEKKLSDNDLGLTGSHQAGILIPKKKELIDFFPSLDKTAINPRRLITFKDETGYEWKFNYIYYNNRLRGGTRNEDRLTGMTKYLRQNLMEVGDYVIMEKKDKSYFISTRKQKQAIIHNVNNEIVIEINDWRMIGE